MAQSAEPDGVPKVCREGIWHLGNWDAGGSGEDGPRREGNCP